MLKKRKKGWMERKWKVNASVLIFRLRNARTLRHLASIWDGQISQLEVSVNQGTGEVADTEVVATEVVGSVVAVTVEVVMVTDVPDQDRDPDLRITEIVTS